MAIPDGKPATDFSAMNREWVRAVAEEAGADVLPSVSGSNNGQVLTVVSGEWAAANPPASGIPAPASPSNGDVLTYDSTGSAWVAAAPGGGGANILFLTEDDDTGELSETYATIESALEAGTIVIIKFIKENGCVFEPVLEASYNGENYEVLALVYGVTAFPICDTYSCAATTDYPTLE